MVRHRVRASDKIASPQPAGSKAQLKTPMNRISPPAMMPHGPTLGSTITPTMTPATPIAATSGQ